MLFRTFFDSEHPHVCRISDVHAQNNIYALETGFNQVPGGLRQVMKRDVFILHYITGGKGTFCGCPFEKGDVVMTVPGETEIHKSNETDPYEAYWIMFRGGEAREMLKKLALPEHNRVFRFDLYETCAQIIRKAVFDITPENELEEFFLLQSALSEIFAAHSQKTQTVPDLQTPSSRAKKFIDNNFFRPINVSELAKSCHCGRSTLYKTFKTDYGKSPLEYLLSVRIEKSKQLLSDKKNGLSISEIAQISGFDDPLYFSRVFRKKTGMSPSEFRQKQP